LCSELFDEEERGADVLVQKVVDGFRRELSQAPASASRVVTMRMSTWPKAALAAFITAAEESGCTKSARDLLDPNSFSSLRTASASVGDAAHAERSYAVHACAATVAL